MPPSAAALLAGFAGLLASLSIASLGFEIAAGFFQGLALTSGHPTPNLALSVLEAVFAIDSQRINVGK
jgi:hypothetical protein